MSDVEVDPSLRPEVDLSGLELDEQQQRVAELIAGIPHTGWFRRADLGADPAEFDTPEAFPYQFRITALKLIDAGMLEYTGAKNHRRYMKIGDWAEGLPDAIEEPEEAESDEPAAARAEVHLSPQKRAVARDLLLLEALTPEQLDEKVRQVELADKYKTGQDTWYSFPTLVAAGKQVLSEASFVVNPAGQRRLIEWDIMYGIYTDNDPFITGTEIAVVDGQAVSRHRVVHFLRRTKQVTMLKGLAEALAAEDWDSKAARTDRAAAVVERFNIAVNGRTKLYGDGRPTHEDDDIMVDLFEDEDL
jgi:hypothetical protein